ncbi:hypothetical protein GW17_00022187 [Ensete ventricosum]|nr:hypothetical protein GW17_00022187 [Ensete ventricosum]
MITSMHPHIKGVNYDLPHVISEAPPYPGVEHVSGDMFESVPSGNAIVLKWILRDWNDEQCARRLKSCWKGLPEGGKLRVVEYILPSIPESSLNSQGAFGFDISIMVAQGGKERTQQEFETLAKETGFGGLKTNYVTLYTWVLEFTKL